jgi:hypothetical protein
MPNLSQYRALFDNLRRLADMSEAEPAAEILSAAKDLRAFIFPIRKPKQSTSLLSPYSGIL